MNIDSETIRSLAQRAVSAGEPISPREAKAIARLAYLVLGADLDEDPDEVSMTVQIGRQVCALAGVPFEEVLRPSPLPLPRDAEARHAWVERIGSDLHGTRAKELAYMVAYLVTVADLEVAPAESRLLRDLQAVLQLSDDRAGDLAAYAAEGITPLA